MISTGVHDNPSYLSGWIQSMLSELNAGGGQTQPPSSASSHLISTGVHYNSGWVQSMLSELNAGGGQTQPPSSASSHLISTGDNFPQSRIYEDNSEYDLSAICKQKQKQSPVLLQQNQTNKRIRVRSLLSLGNSCTMARLDFLGWLLSRFFDHDGGVLTVKCTESQAALVAENLPPPPQLLPTPLKSTESKAALSAENLPPTPRHENWAEDFTAEIALNYILRMNEGDEDLEDHLNASQSSPKHNRISQSHCNEAPIVVDQEGITSLDSDTLLSSSAAMLIDGQENPNEDLGSDEVGAVRKVGEGKAEGQRKKGQVNSGCSRKWKGKEKIRAEEGRNETTNGGRIGISLEEILQTKSMSLKDAANNLEGTRIFTPQLLETVKSTESQAALSAGNVPPPLQLPPTPRQENPGGDFGSGNGDVETVGNGITGTRKIPESLEYEKDEFIWRLLHLQPDEDLEDNLNASQSTPKHSLISQSRCNETPIVVDQEGITGLDSDTLLSSSAAMLIDGQENLNEDLGSDEVEAVRKVGEGKAEGQLSSGCSRKRKGKEKIRAEEGRNEKTNGGRIGISLDEIFQVKSMSRKDAARKLEVSESTLKRYCREYGITRWPPRKKHKLLSQSCPNGSPMIVDQQRITELNSDAQVTSNEVSANVDTTSVTVKARCGDDTYRLQLSSQCGMVELEQEVRQRLPGDYNMKYRDEANELISIVCDADVRTWMSCPIPQGRTWIDVLLTPK